MQNDPELILHLHLKSTYYSRLMKKGEMVTQMCFLLNKVENPRPNRFGPNTRIPGRPLCTLHSASFTKPGRLHVEKCGGNIVGVCCLNSFFLASGFRSHCSVPSAWFAELTKALVGTYGYSEFFTNVCPKRF